MTNLWLMPEQEDLPPGKVWQCSECGTRIKEGQPHSSDTPPHYTLEALIVEEAL